MGDRSQRSSLDSGSGKQSSEHVIIEVHIEYLEPCVYAKYLEHLDKFPDTASLDDYPKTREWLYVPGNEDCEILLDCEVLNDKNTYELDEVGETLDDLMQKIRRHSISPDAVDRKKSYHYVQITYLKGFEPGEGAEREDDLTWLMEERNNNMMVGFDNDGTDPMFYWFGVESIEEIKEVPSRAERLAKRLKKD